MPTFTNNSDGPRGVNIGMETVFLEPGETRDFDGKVDAHPDLAEGGKKAEAKAPETPKSDPEDPLAGLSDDELRSHIEDKTGEKPHHRASRAKLLEIARGL